MAASLIHGPRVGISRLGEMKARFQQRQLQEKEEKLLRLYENQQQRTLERVQGRNSTPGGGDISPGELSSGNSSVASIGGRVRQMFDERRSNNHPNRIAGIDKSYPLDPIQNKNNNNKNPSVTRGVSLDRYTLTKPSTNPNSIKTTKSIVTKAKSSNSYNSRNNNSYQSKTKTTDSNYYTHDDNDIDKYNEKRKTAFLIQKQRQLYESLDDEDFPDVRLIDDDFPIPDIPMQKLPNVGKQLPSERFQTKTTMPKQTITKGRGVAPTKNRNNGVNNTSNTEISSNKTGPTKRVIEKKTLGSGDHKRSTVNNSPKSSSTKIGNEEKSFSPEKPPSVSNRTSKIERENSPKKMQKGSGKSQPSSTQRQSVRSRVTDAPQNASSVSRDDLLPCKFCNRRFASDRLGVHQDICARTAQKKRKPYDALKHRVVGTEVEMYVRKAMRSKSVSQPQALKKNDWRKKHEDFVQAIRAAKQMQAHIAAGGKLSDLPPPPPSTNPDYVQCPHCGRRFNEAAAERHIPKCANYVFNKPNPAAANTSRGRAKK